MSAISIISTQSSTPVLQRHPSAKPSTSSQRPMTSTQFRTRNSSFTKPKPPPPIKQEKQRVQLWKVKQEEKIAAEAKKFSQLYSISTINTTQLMKAVTSGIDLDKSGDFPQLTESKSITCSVEPERVEEMIQKTIDRETRKKLVSIKGNDTGMTISPLTPIRAWDSTEEGTVQYPAHPRRQKNHHKKQRNADLDHGAQNRGKSTQNEGKELLSPDSREAERSMISPSISPAAHLYDVEWKKQKHPLRLQQAQAQTLKLDEVRQPIQGTPTALPVLPPLAIPFSETPPTTAKSGSHGEHQALPEIQENAKTLERREEEAGQTSRREVAHTSRTHTTRTRTDRHADDGIHESESSEGHPQKEEISPPNKTASHRTPITPLSIDAFQIPSAVSFSPTRLSSPRHSLLSPTRVSHLRDDDITVTLHSLLSKSPKQQFSPTLSTFRSS
ncbi:hypothetical protein BLNAU_6153 [Blattamonas nauphoetae]|uniref:Uncharacterized protein n=1 Tax=Blattamonas nauphoetae TaxID=2049346 RepID=A0ABQ9XSB6_9EUKA|nr:hypothetical protein BLNAU_11635 [Blattamonas nauphoetae]KAK2958904.1 hypothetical protein BLNAU_6153 [Blattamonas nauphoetae]